MSVISNIIPHYPDAKPKPVIGITANHQDIDFTLRDRYCRQIVAAGGVPFIIPPVEDFSAVNETLDRIDALLLSGGADHDPRWMGEMPSPLLGRVNAVRDLPELLITRLAYERQMPMLGICRGIQTMAIALDGHVLQDISLGSKVGKDESSEEPTEKVPLLKHSQEEEREVKTHSVSIARGSLVSSIFGSEQLQVNSFHHQAVDDCGNWFRPVAWAEDGVIEAMESSEMKPMVGVQWHPEWLGTSGLPVFTWLVSEADLYHRTRNLHRHILTIDSHCDTPMFFAQGADFSRRDQRILVNLPNMTAGMQDATTMVAYVPQTDEQLLPSPIQESKGELVTPRQYADQVFDRIEQIIAQRPDRLALALNRSDLLRNKAAGRKSIMLGIENARAIESLHDVEHFHRRGARYFTLCHNGDNQVCDSARRSRSTWGGLSPYGRELVAEMNRVGVTVDLSHAAESSFFEALELSTRPVVCSHSNCHALCPHERNLTDQQLKALAQADGVCQITLYSGFVSEVPSEANILRAIDHLNHAVKFMGVEHVGLGTDFDGDGGLPGLKNSSEMLLFTRQLLLQRYSEQDIALIWGENWLRALEQ